jgi:hypothetical protein
MRVCISVEEMPTHFQRAVKSALSLQRRDLLTASATQPKSLICKFLAQNLNPVFWPAIPYNFDLQPLG